jgi:hypothetical protein
MCRIRISVNIVGDYRRGATICPILFFIGALILCSPLGILFIVLARLYAVFYVGGD